MVSYIQDASDLSSNNICNGCKKRLNKNHKVITCNICEHKFHLKCSKIDSSLADAEQKICIMCKEDSLPFQKLSDPQFYSTSKCGLNNDIDALELAVFPTNRLKSFFNDINNLDINLKDEEEDNLNEINCNYVDIDSFEYRNNEGKLSFFHLNIASLPKHKEELETILNMIDHKFDVIGLTETKLKHNEEPIINIDIPGYKTYSNGTEAEKGGALLYIKDNLNGRPLKKLDKLMYKSKQLESIFVEICNKGKKNIIVGCIYRHPSMELSDFNDNYLNPLLEEITTKEKTIFLLGDFNIDLMKIDCDSNTSYFFDSMTSKLFVPHIIHPTRITSTTRTLIDNIYSNSTNFLQGISGNITISISDHLAQFLIIPQNTEKIKTFKNFYKRDFKHFDRENFILDLLDIEWDNVLDMENNNPSQSYKNFESTVNPIVDKYIPNKKLSRKEV